MKNLLYIPNSWHEQIAKAYNLNIVHTPQEADCIILRDPFDRAVEQLMEQLDRDGNPQGLTFEEHLFLQRNYYTDVLDIEMVGHIEPQLAKFKFMTLSSHIIWPKMSGDLMPKKQTRLNPKFSFEELNIKLSKTLGCDNAKWAPNLRFDSNMLDTSLRADFASHNMRDYQVVQKVREYSQFGEFSDES